MVSPKSRAQWLAFLLVLIPCFWRYEGDVWHSKWTVTLVLISLFIGWAVSQSVNSYPAGLATAYTLLSGLWVFSWRDNYYTMFEIPVRCTFDLITKDPQDLFKTTACNLYQFEANSAYATFAFLAFLFFSLTASKSFLHKIGRSFAWSGFLSSILVLFHFFSHKMHSLSTGGFFNQGSMEGVFIAVTYPLLMAEELHPKSPVKLLSNLTSLIPIFACVVLCWKAEASQPLVLIAIALGLEASRNYDGHKIKLSQFQQLIVVMFIVAGLGFIGRMVNPHFLDNNNRFPIYKMAYNFWRQKWDFMVFGLGNGSWSVWGPLLQKTEKVLVGDNFSFMHSDILQTIFEQGFIGLSLLLATGCHALLRAFSSPRKRAYAFSLIIYGASMVFQFPFHLPVHSFLGIFLLAFSLRK